MAFRWRSSFYNLVPSWLSSDDGEKVIYSLARVTDGFIERARQSLTARFPTYVGPTGLRMLGEERGIVRGRDEKNAGFARRLREWRGPRGHLVRGSAFGMLRQIWNYFGGMKCQEVDNSGNVYTIAQDGTESATHGGTWAWDTDSSWYRFWLKLIPGPEQGITGWGPLSAKPWGASLEPGRGFTIGQRGVTPGDCATVARLFTGTRPWKMSGTKLEWLIVVLDQDEAHAPNGEWDLTSQRYDGWRYWRF